MAREEATYAVPERPEATYNGRDYRLLLYDCGTDTNPYSRGASAFGAFGNYAVIAEVTATDAWDGDEAAALASFLEGCHFSAANLKR